MKNEILFFAIALSLGTAQHLLAPLSPSGEGTFLRPDFSILPEDKEGQKIAIFSKGSGDKSIIKNYILSGGKWIEYTPAPSPTARSTSRRTSFRK